jgi:hypothetical protein
MDVAWYVSANDKLFGPYSHEQMKSFALQKRLMPQSLVRMGSEGGFVAAETHAALARLFVAGEGSSSSGPQRPQAAAPQATTNIADGQVSNFVVIVDVRSGSFRKAESEIKALGRTLRINQQTWLLQTDKPANTIKNALAPHLGADDPLVVIDAGRNRLAWHNLGVFEASSARELWKLPGERV